MVAIVIVVSVAIYFRNVYVNRGGAQETNGGGNNDPFAAGRETGGNTNFKTKTATSSAVVSEKNCPF